ncbi:MAG: neutral zinc metallopeptidase [Desulfomicrobium sp.]
MKWRGRQESANIEDRRGRSVRRAGVGGIGGLGIVVAIIYMLMGGNPLDLLTLVREQPVTHEQSQGSYRESAEEKQLRQFSAVVLRETENVWNELFARSGRSYEEPTLTIYSGSVQSGCGFASAGSGPFYCPLDRKIYLDLGFYDVMRDSFGAPGDFAMAYVIAHEVGHHVQNLLGVLDQVHAMRPRISQEQFNALSVKLELQADYLAGVFAHHVQDKNLLDEGDFEEAMGAASAVGDDTIQEKTQGYIMPDSFTHGTSEQRMRWFRKGFQAGDMSQGDTFEPGAM